MNYNERCKNLVASVENISQNEMEEIFKMIHTHGCSYTRNNNGLFINLAWIPEDLLKELEQYVKFCTRSQTELKKYELICDVLNSKLREDSANSKDVILHVNINAMPPIQNIEDIQDIDQIAVVSNLDDFEETEIKTDPLLVDPDNENDIEKPGSKISSSMKYALLKKRYAKLGTFNNNIENDLKRESYIL